MNFDLNKPCSNCPFRKDKFFYLQPSRALGIVKSVTSGRTFSCHKTVRAKKPESHCAGVLIILAKQDKLFDSNSLRMAIRLGLLNPSTLKLSSPVYDKFEDYLDLLVEE